MKKIQLIYVSLMLLFSGCIVNDIPYPIVQANIAEFEITGQVSSTINTEAMRVEVTLPETVYIKEAKVAKYRAEEGVKSTPEPSVGEVIDLSSPYSMVLTVYQDYKWEIVATQNVERKFTVDGQVGEATFDVENLTATAKVSEGFSMSSIKVRSLKLAPIGSIIAQSIDQLTDFTTPQKVTVTYRDEVQEWTLSVVESTIMTSQPAEIWAKSVMLSGDVYPKDNSVYGFEIKSVDGEFAKVDESTLTLEGSTLTSLVAVEPSSTYVYRLYQDDKYADEVSFSTPAAPTIPNMDMNGWSESKFWLPYASGQAPYWITGNEGVATFGKSNSFPTDDAVEGKAALMETVKVPVVKIGAGNLYTGTFKTNLSNPLLSTKFGQPFTGRPKAIRGMYKYTQKTIDIAKSAEDKQYIGTPDKGIGWIRLEDWNGAATLPSPDAYTKIAFGELLFDKTVAEYTSFEIPIVYESDATPSHISLCFSSSYLGEKFVGGIGSILWVDNLEFVY